MNHQNKSKYLICFFLLALVFSCTKEKIANEQIEKFVKFFGSSYTGEGMQISQLEDGSYILAGHTSSNDSLKNDFYLAKADVYGNETWSKRIGRNADEKLYSMQILADGGYILAGTTNITINSISYTNVLLVRTNANGDTLWTRTIGGAQNITGNCIQVKNDGSFLIAGNILSAADNNDASFITTDSQGLNEKIRIKKADGNQTVKYIIEKEDNFLLIGSNAGALDVKGTSDIYLLSATPLIISSPKTFGGNGADFGKAIKQLLDGSFIGIATYTSPKDSGNNFGLFKFTTQGDSIRILWFRDYGTLLNDDVSAVAITKSGIAMTGTTTNSDGSTDILFIRTDFEGNEQLKRSIGGLGNQRAFGLCKTADDGVVIAGNNENGGNSVLMLIKLK